MFLSRCFLSQSFDKQTELCIWLFSTFNIHIFLHIHHSISLKTSPPHCQTSPGRSTRLNPDMKSSFTLMSLPWDPRFYLQECPSFLRPFRVCNPSVILISLEEISFPWTTFPFHWVISFLSRSLWCDFDEEKMRFVCFFCCRGCASFCCLL